MLDYKKVFNKTIQILKENKLLLILSLIISFFGILFFGNIFSNYNYLFNHKYFITFTNNSETFLTVIQSLFYNSILPNSGEIITNIFNFANKSPEYNKDLIFNIFTFVSIFLSFFIINTISTIIIFISKKQKFSEIFNEIKSSLKYILLIDLLKSLIITIIFLIISLIGIFFSINSYLFLIISSIISGLLFFILFFLYNYSIRYVIFFKENSIISIKNAYLLFIKNIKDNIISLFVLLFYILIIFVITILISLPILFINTYLLNSSGYQIFNDINNIFIIIVTIIFSTLSNIFIIKFLNEVFGDLISKNN